DMLTRMVADMGYSTTTAATGKDALARLQEQPADIVLLDLTMPEMDGFEFCQAVQAGAHSRDLHIIITSARDTLEEKVKGLSLGAADYLTKPFSLIELQARIKVGERIVRYQKTLREQQSLLEQLARQDALTGLANRRCFDERAREEAVRAKRYRHPLSLLLADLDHFKSINDTHGHAFGDTVLREVGQTFFRYCRATDLCARYGGEEFVILLPETGLEDARNVAERLCSAVRSLVFHPPQNRIHITVSFGAASMDPDYRGSIEGILEQADQGLYQAKRSGRDRVAVHASE
ncbi:MAG: diguanylate cyclase, partial [Thermodesulfobacteriota bacterium]